MTTERRPSDEELFTVPHRRLAQRYSVAPDAILRWRQEYRARYNVPRDQWPTFPWEIARDVLPPSAPPRQRTAVEPDLTRLPERTFRMIVRVWFLAAIEAIMAGFSAIADAVPSVLHFAKASLIVTGYAVLIFLVLRGMLVVLIGIIEIVTGVLG